MRVLRLSGRRAPLDSELEDLNTEFLLMRYKM